MFKSGDYDKAADILGNVLDVIEEEYKGVRKAGMIDKELVIRKVRRRWSDMAVY